MHHVVFICTGNLCRSPMAERILRRKWADLKRNDLVVTSMGTYAPERKPATELAIEVCKEHGLDLKDHLSRPLNPGELDRADLVLTMEKVQKDFILLFLPQLYEKVYLLGAWPEKETRKSVIPDPMGRSLRDFRKTFQMIDSQVERIMPDLTDFLR